jgi:hypothetical protein
MIVRFPRASAESASCTTSAVSCTRRLNVRARRVEELALRRPQAKRSHLHAEVFQVPKVSSGATSDLRLRNFQIWP